MSLNFAVRLKATGVVSDEKQKIDSISVAGEIIGYVCANKITGTATAFNAAGQQSEEHCPGCALKQVIAWKTGLEREVVEIATNENPASLILSAILSSAASKH